MIGTLTAACGGFLAGWICRARLLPMGPPNGSYGGRFDPDWRRSFSHENTNRPSGPPPLKLRRSGDVGSLRPTTPKPEIAPKPQYPGGYISLDGAQPFRVRGRLQPLPDELDAYTYQRGPQGDTPNPPPEAP